MPLSRRKWQRVLLAWLILFTCVTFYALHVALDTAAQNRQRIVDIQESRISGCRQVYEGVRDVFKPFFPPVGHRTVKQQRDLAKFNRTVDRLKARCVTQTQAAVDTGGTP